jgi:hypothetical protein
MYMHTNRPASRPRLDWAGTLLASSGLFCIVFGFSHAETAGWTAALTIGSLALGAAVLAAFAFAEGRVSHPLLPLRVIVDRTRGGAYVAVGLAGIAIFGVFLFLTYLPAAGQGVQPGHLRPGLPAEDRLHPGQLQRLHDGLRRLGCPVRARHGARHRAAAVPAAAAAAQERRYRRDSGAGR